MPLTRSATGGRSSHFLPRAITDKWLKRELSEQARKALPPTTMEEVEQWIAETRRRGFASTSDFIPGIGGMAAPVFDHTGSMVLALIALGYSKPFNAELGTDLHRRPEEGGRPFASSGLPDPYLPAS